MVGLLLTLVVDWLATMADCFVGNCNSLLCCLQWGLVSDIGSLVVFFEDCFLRVGCFIGEKRWLHD